MFIFTHTLIDLLKQRNDNRNAIEFFDVFIKFVKAIYNGSLHPFDTEYYAYILKRCRTVGQYCTVKCNSTMIPDAQKLVLKHAAFCDEIKQDGIKKPLEILYEQSYGLEIDGYHRLVIAKVLGIDIIPCTIREKVLIVMAHPDDELIFGWPVLLDNTINKEVLICSNDYCNKYRPTMYARKEALAEVCKSLGIVQHSLNFESEFYRRNVRNRDLLQFESLVESLIQDANIIFTHNPFGEYGHMDHKLVSNICFNSKAHVMFTDILDTAEWSNTVEISKNWKYLYGNALSSCTLDKNTYETLKAIYTKHNVWTWFKEPIDQCNLFMV